MVFVFGVGLLLFVAELWKFSPVQDPADSGLHVLVYCHSTVDGVL